MFCCISGCTSRSMKTKHKTTGVKFYYFPSYNPHMPWLCDKRQKWTDAVKKHTRHPNDWVPGKYATVCSAHFIGNKKSENPLDPSYVPTIFPAEKSKSHKLKQKLTRSEMLDPSYVPTIFPAEKSKSHKLKQKLTRSEMHQHRVQRYTIKFCKKQKVQPERLVKPIDHHQKQQVSEINTVNDSLQWTEGNIQTERLTDQSIGCQSDNLSTGPDHHQKQQVSEMNTVNDSSQWTEENIETERLANQDIGCQSDDLSTGIDHHQMQQVSEMDTVNDSLQLTEENINTERLADQDVGCQSDDLSTGLDHHQMQQVSEMDTVNLSTGLDHHQIQQVAEMDTVNDSLQLTEENIKTERLADQDVGCQSDDSSTGLDHHQMQQVSEMDTVNDSLQLTEENIKTERLADQDVGCQSDDLSTGLEHHQIQQVSEINNVNNSLQITEVNIKTERLTDLSVGCQTDDLSVGHQGCDTYLFSSMININGICTAEIQTNIASKAADKSCELNIPMAAQVKKEFSDPLDQYSQELLCPGFHGISSIKTEADLISLTGVTYAVFQMLLNMLPDDSETSNINKKTQLLITLMKLKSGLCFSVLSIMFQIHKRTVSRLFEETLFLLHSALKKFIIWPSKSTVQANMPEPFKLHCANTRVIIDCAEVETEYPPTVEQRDHMYSEYKHGYTIKFLVGCTPCGFISFVSKCYGGCTSDCFITNDCGLFYLLELGDTALADKGSITKIGVENKNSVLVRTPFLHPPQFSSEEVDEPNQIASPSIHIERIMQKIKQFHIFDKMPISLLKYRDEIVFTVCALVNIENPIVK